MPDRVDIEFLIRASSAAAASTSKAMASGGGGPGGNGPGGGGAGPGDPGSGGQGRGGADNLFADSVRGFGVSVRAFSVAVRWLGSAATLMRNASVRQTANVKISSASPSNFEMTSNYVNNYRQQAAASSVGSLRTGAAIATGAAAGIMAAGNPLAWNTFIGSVRLLATSLASLLTPAFLRISMALQGAARWIRGLSDETKRNLASWLVWGAGLALGAAVLGKILTLLLAVRAALVAVGVGSLASSLLGAASRGATALWVAYSPVVTRIGAAMYAAVASAASAAGSALWSAMAPAVARVAAAMSAAWAAASAAAAAVWSRVWALAGPMVGRIGTALTGAFASAGSILMRAGASFVALLSTPIGALMAAAVALAAAGAYLAYRMVSQNRRAVSEELSMRESLQGGPLRDAQWQHLPAEMRSRIAGQATAEQRNATMQSIIAANNNRIAALGPAASGTAAAQANAEVSAGRLAQFGALAQGVGPFIGNIINGAAAFFGQREIDRAQAPRAEAERLRTQNAILSAAIRGGIPGVADASGSGGGANGMRARLLLAGMDVQAQEHGGAQEYMSSVTLGAIGRGPLDQEILRQIMVNTGDTVTETRALNRNLPGQPGSSPSGAMAPPSSVSSSVSSAATGAMVGFGG